MRHLISAALACLTPLTLIACDRPASPIGVATTPATWLLTEAPADSRPIGEIKPTAAEGDAVILRARIGGRKEPITPGAAVFIVIDPSVPSCDQIPGDNCPTPWDYCCEPRESLSANSATIQLVDAQGTPIQTDLIAAGFKPLDEVIIIGTVAARPSEQVLTIRATGIHKVGG